MHVKIPAIAALFAAALHCGEAYAQTADENRMRAFMKSNFYSGLINQALVNLPQSVFQRCPTLVSNGSRTTVLKPISFATDGFPNAGSWKQSFPVSGCGNDTILNFYFSATSDEKINTIVGVPGTTHADLTLQRDAVLYANLGATLAVKVCKTFIVKNSRFEGYGIPKPPIADPGPRNPRRPWRETWTMVGCNHTIDIPIYFVPDAKGTQIIQPGGAVER